MRDRNHVPPERPPAGRRILRSITQLVAGAILAAITITALHMIEALR